MDATDLHKRYSITSSSNHTTRKCAKENYMIITITVPMSDIMTVKEFAPAMAAGHVIQFMDGLKDYTESKEKKGLTVKASFSIINGFSFQFEGKAEDIVKLIEDKNHVDLKVLIEACTASALMMVGAVKASEESWKARQPKE